MSIADSFIHELCIIQMDIFLNIQFLQYIM